MNATSYPVGIVLNAQCTVVAVVGRNSIGLMNIDNDNKLLEPSYQSTTTSGLQYRLSLPNTSNATGTSHGTWAANSNNRDVVKLIFSPDGESMLYAWLNNTRGKNQMTLILLI